MATVMARVLLAALLALAAPALAAPALAAPPPAASGTLDVRAFGASCDDHADDTAAINAALAAARAHRFAGQTLARIRFPAGGVCRITATLNATGLRGFATVIDGAGAVLDCEVSAAPCVDAIFSRFLHVKNLTITANGKPVPTIGLQLGLASLTPGAPAAGVSDSNEFDDLTVQGHFSLAAVYDRASETTLWKHLLAWNDDTAATAYDLVLDGYNHFGVTSRFQHVTLPRDKAISFQENTFITPDLRRTGPGAAIWMGSTMRPRFLGGYIGNTAAKGTTNDGVILYGSNTLAVFDIHFEAFPYLAHAFVVAAPPGQRAIEIDGLSVRDNAYEGSASFFAADPALTGGVALSNARIEIGGIMPGVKIFDDPGRWSVAGIYRLPPRFPGWNLPAARFTGLGETGAATTLSVSPRALRLAPGAPASSHAPCAQGQLATDAAYVYVCTAPDTWKRAPLSGY